MTLAQLILCAITCSGSLCMNLGDTWRRWGVLCGLVNGPLWMWSEYAAGNQGGMLISSMLIWLTYFIGAWREYKTFRQQMAFRIVAEGVNDYLMAEHPGLHQLLNLRTDDTH